MSKNTAEQSNERLRVANELLPLINEHTQLERVNGRLWIVKGGRYPERKAAVLSSCGQSLACDYQHLGMGSTRAWATAMLVRFIRDLPRVPTERIGKRFGRELAEKLQAAGYDDPAKTGCIFCGSAEIEDWWSHGQVTGPCCSGWLGCKTRHAKKAEAAQ